MGLRILVCGSRHWPKPIPIDVVIGGFVAVYGAQNVTVIHGAGGKADSMASSAAHRHGADTDPYPARWEEHDRDGTSPVPCRCAPDALRCKVAGPRRNQRMLDKALPDVVMAFTDSLAASSGTFDMVRRARKAGIPAYVIGKHLELD